MNKWLARAVQYGLAAGIAFAGLWSVFGGGVSWAKIIGHDDYWMGGDTLMTVTGDSTTYYITNHLMPATSPGKDGGKDTTATADVRACDKIAVTVFGSGDSLAYWVDYTMDGTNWTNLIDSTFVNAAESADFPPTTASWNTIVTNQFVHIASGTNLGVTWRDWMIPKLRVRLQNADVLDTLINARVRVWCGD